MGWKIASTLHTILRRNNAHPEILHTIASNTIGYVIDPRMQLEQRILNLSCDRESIEIPLSTPRAKSPSRERSHHPPFCILFSLHVLPDLASPDLAMFDDDGSNLLHTRPHNPDGLEPDGGHPRLRRETLYYRPPI